MGAVTARWRGALAGLVPMLAIALLFVVSGTGASPLQLAGSFTLVTVGTTAAGWLAGPLAASEPRRMLIATLGYAIALIGAMVAGSVVQGIVEVISTDGPDPVAIIFAIIFGVIVRLTYAVAGILYLMGPALALGAAWTVAARGLIQIADKRTASSA